MSFAAVPGGARNSSALLFLYSAFSRALFGQHPGMFGLYAAPLRRAFPTDALVVGEIEMPPSTSARAEAFPSRAQLHMKASLLMALESAGARAEQIARRGCSPGMAGCAGRAVCAIKILRSESGSCRRACLIGRVPAGISWLGPGPALKCATIADSLVRPWCIISDNENRRTTLCGPVSYFVPRSPVLPLCEPMPWRSFEPSLVRSCLQSSGRARRAAAPQMPTMRNGLRFGVGQPAFSLPVSRPCRPKNDLTRVSYRPPYQTLQAKTSASDLAYPFFVFRSTDNVLVAGRARPSPGVVAQTGNPRLLGPGAA